MPSLVVHVPTEEQKDDSYQWVKDFRVRMNALEAAGRPMVIVFFDSLLPGE